ncbi:unnamed protein product [Moneuplotes crassus]|uniref:Uncharacterized protein n=1 Tax=Euplotes crassus TaxID=5936 RepID=A0AAD1Y1H7_EUPCR|nr:unnamed protein product [Moneuplotes crassus]
MSTMISLSVTIISPRGFSELCFKALCLFSSLIASFESLSTSFLTSIGFSVFRFSCTIVVPLHILMMDLISNASFGCHAFSRWHQINSNDIGIDCAFTTALRSSNNYLG